MNHRSRQPAHDRNAPSERNKHLAKDSPNSALLCSALKQTNEFLLSQRGFRTAGDFRDKSVDREFSQRVRAVVLDTWSNTSAADRSPSTCAIQPAPWITEQPFCDKTDLGHITSIIARNLSRTHCRKWCTGAVHVSWSTGVG